MYFTVLAHGVRIPAHSESRAFLLTDNWDDWFKYSTMYTLVVDDDVGERHSIDSVKIGQFEMEEGAAPRSLRTLTRWTIVSSRLVKMTVTMKDSTGLVPKSAIEYYGR